MKKKVELLHPLLSPTDLSPKHCAAVAEALNPLVADIFALFIKTKNFHWHMVGPHYRDYHLLLDEHAEQIFALTDVLAERVRKLGERTIQSIGQIKSLSHIKDCNQVLGPEGMLEELLEDNKHLLGCMRSAHGVASKACDVATTSLLETFIDETERRTWFLFETLKK